MDIKLSPEEQLVVAIFGSRWVKHLSPEGCQAVRDVLSELQGIDERGVRVLRLRFGFEPRTDKEKAKRTGGTGRSLEEVKVYFDVTRERIRQIEAKTLRRLRHPLSQRLNDYLE